ncbi:MAG: hypothetical protein R3E79_17925 [Caldilineaceae bacterium]
MQNKFFLLALTSLWLVGLYGVLFGLGYLVQFRRRFWWRAQREGDTPRIMALLYLSFGLFCVGLAGHTYLLPPTALAATRQTTTVLAAATGQWLIAVVWLVLALLAVSQAGMTAIAGLRLGWDESLTALADRPGWDVSPPGMPHPLVRWLAAALLLCLVLLTFGSGLYQLWVMVAARIFIVVG